MLSMEQNEMIETPQDRRVMRRFDMRLPAAIKMTGDDPDQMLTETMNVSAKGVFFYLDRKIEEGCPLEITLTFPPHVTLTETVRVRFTAKVIRVESPLPVSRVGVAAVIEDYEFLKAISGQIPVAPVQ